MGAAELRAGAGSFVARDGRLVLGDLGIIFDPNAERLTENLADPPLSRDWIPPWHPEDGYDARWDLFMLARTAIFLVAGAKLKQNSWLSRQEFSLPTRFPDVHGIQAVMDFFRRAFVEEKQHFPWETSALFKQELRELIDTLAGQTSPRLVGCPWTRVSGPNNSVGVPILISQPFKRLRACAVASRGPMVGLQLATGAENKLVAETPMTPVVTGERVMTDELVLTPRARMVPGWYRLHVRVHGSADSYIEGISVYAE